MAKGKANVVIKKQELLLPKMEFLSLNDSGEGFFIKELGGKSLLQFYEMAQAEKEKESDAMQAVQIMIELVYLTACNADGSPFFSSKEEVELFADTSILQLYAAFEKAQTISGISGVKNSLKNGLLASSTTD